ncbi:hybrid sensor histidine kinase/response regulator [Azospirillum sp. YIM B02556]|uniref:histidine kinase n=1 Tax=Azospirillum endophyticum TaxID=2800326 RepID=A0ABS1FFD1_9PROT|nr:hybrid sensor histidine kinase/response regulator [Azospirillum endophyticum]
MQSWLVLAVSAAYLGVLFAIAWWGDRRTAGGALLSASPRATGILYALTLCIYNTSWSFYGSVGRASASGFDFLPIYLAPMILLLVARPVLTKTIAITKAQNVTSIADFIGARYGKSQAVAALVTLTALVGVLPYIALQLKAVAASFDVLTSPSLAAPATLPPPVWGDTAFAVALSMAVFTILFGVRHINASEHHRGLMLAIAFESLVKLTVFLAVAAFIVWGMFDGYADLITRPQAEPLLSPDFTDATWWSNTAISIIAFLCLPQMYHVMTVENDSPRHLRAAAWMYPTYLLALSALMIPIAVAGLVTFEDGINPDTFMITLPIAAGAGGFSLLSFIGGLSAATGMVIVAAVSLSTMLCNDVVMPLLLRRKHFAARVGRRDMVGTLLLVRRLSVLGILLLAYVMHRLVDHDYPLTVIGLLSFVAVAQFGPAFFGGLYWPRANRVGALAGLGAGFLLWVYTLLVPSMARIVPVPDAFLDLGPWGIGWLRPQALFGIEGLDPISHASLWSLLANLIAFVAGSLLARPSAVERTQAVSYTTATAEEEDEDAPHAPARLADLRALAIRFVGAERGNAAFDAYAAGRKGEAGPADLDAVRFTETLIAGAIGAASARVVMAASLQGRSANGRSLSRGDAMAMLDEASEALHFNRKLLQATLENVGQGICVIDADHRIAAWNHRYLELLDLPADMVRVGVPFADLIRFNTERGEYSAHDMKALLTNRDTANLQWPYRYERRRPDGTVLEILANPLPEGGYVSTYTDVTERYRAAEALREANESLEHRVRERTDALQQAKAEAEAANASKTRFLAAASHDLLQPLNAARLFVSALEESVRGPLPTPGQRTAECGMIDNAAASLRSTEMLLGGLLDISSLDAGNVRVQVRSFAIDELLGGLGVEFSALAQERGLTLKVVGCSAVVRSDPQLLRRILQNFLSNAVRYTPEGRILLGCRRRDAGHGDPMGGDRLRIEVWDTGPGIPETKRREVFEEFRRLGGENGGGNPADKGLGLGLAIVDRIARLLGHPVTLRSTVGRGTGFAVEVPMEQARAAPVDRPVSTPAALSAGLLVLCIDNEEPILAGLRALLGQWGCRVATASDVAGALAAMAPFDGTLPDVVCVDYHVGNGQTGLAVLERLRELWDRPVKGLLLTADRSEAVRAEAERCGCGVLYKPVKPASLRRFLNGAALQTAAVTER